MMIAQSQEWLESDGLGGFASGTAATIRTRRYHALLLTATTPPTGRIALVNGFDAWIETPTGRFSLSSQCYAPGVIGDDGASHIETFTHEPWPRWIFKVADGTRVQLELFAVHGEPLTCLTWKLLSDSKDVKLFVRPFLSGRDYHSMHKANGAFQFEAELHPGRITWQPYAGVPGVTALTNALYEPEPHWYHNFLHTEERDRGLDCEEDLAAPGVLSWNLANREAVLLLTTRAHAENFAEKTDAIELAAHFRARELARRQKFPTPLHAAADAYIVRGRLGTTIIAGYPWFADWGRDTLIALRGLCLATGRLDEAREILLTWAGTVSKGMLPNRFSDQGDRPEFNAVDASLWFVIAAHEYLVEAGILAASEPGILPGGNGGKFRRQDAALTGGQDDCLHKLLSACEAILEGYARGTRYNIKLDSDGLIACGEPGVQLTWMDAKVGDWVVTPRIGKPVEIQALWLNALSFASKTNPKWKEHFDRGLESFRRRFWNDARRCLFDVVDVNHQPGVNDPAIRPNQIFAIGGLPVALFDDERARLILESVEDNLLTPLGLRSLAASEPGYVRRYEGGVRERDGAYHQGTVWPWLIGPFVEAWVRARGNGPTVRKEAREKFLKPLLDHLNETGLGHVSEIADAESPHVPRGCPFQAWSVGELLRLDQVVLRVDESKVPGKSKRRREISLSQRERETARGVARHSEDCRPDAIARFFNHPTLAFMNTTEHSRLTAANSGAEPWRRWGPYLSERQWGTVREDYSAHGNAWEYFPHDHARSRVYRWGEDGIAGISDDQSRLCFSLALWNGKDPILKERLFGLTNSEGNHGEDAKELYYYLDATPTHSYLKMLYKYPLREFPYGWLVDENGRRKGDANQPEFELLDTGIFDDDRYFDVYVEYAKADTDDILMLVTVHNRGPEAATIHLLPQLWFRNTWSWKTNGAKPSLHAQDGGVVATHHELGEYRLFADRVIDNLPHPGPLPKEREKRSANSEQSTRLDFTSGSGNDLPLPGREGRGEGEPSPTFLFTENETNPRRHHGQPDAPGFFKDAFHEYVIHGNKGAVNSQQLGTKAAAHYQLTIAAGGSASVRVRLVSERGLQSASASELASTTRKSPTASANPPRSGLKSALQSFADFDAVFTQRRREADEFYAALQQDLTDADARNVQRQAFAGMIWSKQFFCYDVPEWIKGDAHQPPPPPERKHGRNSEWMHLNNADIISMPDKWEYPWYAAWDLAFHTIPLALVDPAFAKHQLVLLTREWYMHPNGQLPAYEWAFGDVNPPVHAWATWRVFQMDRKQRRETNPSDPGDLAFLERVYHKLLLNFTWWVNRKDAQGRNIFQGGFLGLDNIGVFDRSAPLPTGGFINQADGTAWMAMYSLNLLRIALELAKHNKVYEDIATKFFEHFLHIVEAMNNIGDEGIGLWDETDEFYYDVLNLPNGQSVPLKVRSLVGLIPLFAVETLEPELLKELPEFSARLEWFLNSRPDLAKLVSRWNECGDCERQLLSLLRGHRMKCLLRRMLDETEFLSDYGVRALSKHHEREPYQFHTNGHTMEVGYWPAESKSGLFGGNSNWRGPIWMPVNFLIIESLQKFHHYYGDDFKVECPTGSGRFLTINEVADELTRRLTRLFLKGDDGQRPVLKYHAKLATDPHFKDYVLFHEYFHGDNGRGVGASHQTGWTGLVAKLLQPRRKKAQPAAPKAVSRTRKPRPSELAVT